MENLVVKDVPRGDNFMRFFVRDSADGRGWHAVVGYIESETRYGQDPLLYKTACGLIMDASEGLRRAFDEQPACQACIEIEDITARCQEEVDAIRSKYGLATVLPPARIQ